MVKAASSARATAPAASRMWRSLVFIRAGLLSPPSRPPVEPCPDACGKLADESAAVRTLLTGFLLCNGEPVWLGDTCPPEPRMGRIREFTPIYRLSLSIASIQGPLASARIGRPCHAPVRCLFLTSHVPNFHKARLEG